MIILEIEGGLWTVTLNRPKKANSLTGAMLEELRDVIRRAATEGAACLVLTGSGKVFSAGADLDEAKAGLATSPLWEEVSQAVADFPGLSIAALNGTLAGGACGMALACDLRIGVPQMKIFYPVMRLGYLPQPSDPARLVALVGPARAKMILMAGQKIASDEAVLWGLVDRLVEPEALGEAVALLTSEVLAAPAGHAAAIKRMIG